MKHVKNEMVNQGLIRRLNRRSTSKVWLGLTGAALLLAGATALAALDHLLPKAPHRQTLNARLDWYAHHGQLKADGHTLASAIEFIMGSDRETSDAATLKGLPVAKSEVVSSPES